MNTNVYIDGLNLYYGSLKDTKYKWLNLEALCSNILSEDNKINKIKLFTARVKPTADDRDVHSRQHAYLSALGKYTPEVEIYFGHFSEHIVRMRLAESNKKKKFAQVIKREEKGSDVNLAVHLLNDAWKDDYQCAVIISNDSDLTESLKLIKTQTDKILGVISPFKSCSKELSKYSHFQRTIRKHILEKSQLPNKIPYSKIQKPDSW